jgi:ankyrin repeat protein
MDTVALCCRNGHVEIARLLLQNGADVNAKSKWLAILLSIDAAFNGHIDILHLLVENGADLEAQNMMAGEHCIGAAYKGHLPFVQELISRYHVDINARDNHGNTAL